MSSPSIAFPGLLAAVLRRPIARPAPAATAAHEEDLPPPPPPRVRVHVCGDPVEAAFLRTVLADEGIPFLVEGGGVDPYGLTFVPQRGFCTLVVSAADCDRAREVIAAALSPAPGP